MALGPIRLCSDDRKEGIRIVSMDAIDSKAELNKQSSSNNNNNIRPYVRSSTHKLRWTRKLHQSFMAAVELLGGEYYATPKRIVQLMDMDGVTLAHVKSHLQMLRMGKVNVEGMPDEDGIGTDDNHPILLFKPISRLDPTFGCDQQDLDLSPKEAVDMLMALRLLKTEGKNLESSTVEQEKLVQGLSDFQRYSAMSPSQRKGIKLEAGVKTHEFLPMVDVKTHNFVYESVSTKDDHINLNLTMSTTYVSPRVMHPTLQFPSPSTPEEAALSLGLSVSSHGLINQLLK